MERQRLIAIDALRGTIMIIMALDHIRDFFHIDAAAFPPTDLSKTTAALFLTRWITHFCLPVFMFAAGLGVSFYGRRFQTKGRLSQFLITRGFWFILLEVTVMRFAYNFNLSPQFPLLLLILWIFGGCMLAMAALVHLPIRWLATLSAVVILLHNTLDAVNAAQFGAAAWIWNLLHQPGIFFIHGFGVITSYPIVPWLAVMAGGFCFGPVFLLHPARRTLIMLRSGLALTAAFLVIRALNLYGDPVPWSVQKSPLFTLLSFLNCTKYPASLDFLLMTLGPALLLLCFFDKRFANPRNPLAVLGRVPLFYFIAHFLLIHILAVLLACLRYGTSALAFIFNPVPSMGGPAELFPPNFGYPLWVVYVLWLFVVAALYPLCRWFANVKATSRNPWLSYL